MTEAVTPGSIWLAGRSGWAALNGTQSAFENKVQADGSTFFFMAGAITATVIGFDRQRTLRAALQRLIRNVESHHCNAIEITHVSLKTFLKVPYVSVSAHARHLQKGLTFDGTDLSRQLKESRNDDADITHSFAAGSRQW